MILLIGIIIALIGVSAYLYGQSKGLEKNSAVKTERKVDLRNQEPSAVPTIIASESELQEAPVVVIQAEGAYPPQDVLEIKERIIAPFLDYKKEVQPGQLVSFSISQNTQPSKDVYPYLADAIFKNGGNEGFVIGKTNGHINWYVPECMGGCQFSEEFSLTYPEIVKLTQ